MGVRTLILLGVVLVCFLVLIQALLFKPGLIYVVKKWWRWIEDCFHIHQFLKVPKFNESMQENQLYRRVSLYLNSLSSLEDFDFTNLVTGKKPNDVVLCLDPNQTVEDNFIDVVLTWTNADKMLRNDCRSFVLKVRKADKHKILRPYLQHIHSVADDIKLRKQRDLKLYMNIKCGEEDNDHHHHHHRSKGGDGRWRSAPFTHPSTFDTIAMEDDLKNKVKSDLESFVKSKQYYHHLGRIWKQSFLLYGPSETGKSSFVAAMANFISYDVYVIDLSKVLNDSDLNLLFLQTTSKFHGWGIKLVLRRRESDGFHNDEQQGSCRRGFGGKNEEMKGVWKGGTKSKVGREIEWERETKGMKNIQNGIVAESHEEEKKLFTCHVGTGWRERGGGCP